MIIISPGTSHQISVLCREHEIQKTAVDEYLIEFRTAGGDLDIIQFTAAIAPDDNSSPYLFSFSKSFAEKDLRDVCIYHLPDGVDAEILAVVSELITSPVADSLISLSQALDQIESPPECNLVHRGRMYCTASTEYYPYQPVSSEFTVIEKDRQEYKTR